MRVSPTKIQFLYQQTPNIAPIYSPRLKQSGYVVGEPIVMRQSSHGVSNFQTFSPGIERPRSVTQNPKINMFVNEYQAAEPIQFAPPSRREYYNTNTDRREQTNRNQQLTVPLSLYRQLQLKYDQLQQKYQKLQRKTSNFNLKDKEKDPNFIIQLIQKYKRNTLEECRLLMERTRLETKEAQIQRLTNR